MDDDKELTRLHARVEGRVQGVGFRYFVRENANWVGVKGWVRNRWDGSVEVVAEGDRQALDRLVKILWQGPRASLVTNIKLTWDEASGEFRSFGVRQTH